MPGGRGRGRLRKVQLGPATIPRWKRPVFSGLNWGTCTGSPVYIGRQSEPSRQLLYGTGGNSREELPCATLIRLVQQLYTSASLRLAAPYQYFVLPVLRQ